MHIIFLKQEIKICWYGLLNECDGNLATYPIVDSAKSQYLEGVDPV